MLRRGLRRGPGLAVGHRLRHHLPPPAPGRVRAHRRTPGGRPARPGHRRPRSRNRVRPRQRGAVPTGDAHPRPPRTPRCGTAHHAAAGEPARRTRPGRTLRGHPPGRRPPVEAHSDRTGITMTPTTVVDPRHLINEGETVNRRPRMPASGPVRPLAPDAVQMSLRQLRRFQWAVRATLAVGVAASVSANVLHAQDNLIAQTIAAWPPLALLITVELVSRVPMHRRGLALARICGTAVIAGIAAYVSYFHMAAVAARYGESGLAPNLLPLSVDGLIIVASVSLIELAGRVRAALDGRAEARPITGAAEPAASAPEQPPAEHPDNSNHNGHRQPSPPLT